MSGQIGPMLPAHLQEALDKITPQNDTDEEDIIGPPLPPPSPADDDVQRLNEANDIGPQLPPHLAQKLVILNTETVIDIGPKLPPHLSKINLSEETGPSSSSSRKKSDFYGPSLPPNLSKNAFGPTLPPGKILAHEITHFDEDDNEDSSDGSLIGPSIDEVLKPGDDDNTLTDDIEKRSKHMKDKLINKDKIEAPQREEWMTELPSIVGKKLGLGLGPRKFAKRSGPSAAEKDRSGWTETPNDVKQNEKKKIVEEPEITAEDLALYRKNTEIAKNLEEFNKNKRKESLADIHKKKLKKKMKEDDCARREFDRDKDLNAKTIDTALTKTIADRAKLFNTRFSHGSDHFL